MPNARSFASYYDFYDPPEYRRAQLDFYAGIAEDTGSPILELASGTGIISLALARQGHNLTGIDISADMLNVAREKLTHEIPAVLQRVEHIEADMADFDIARIFRAILIPANSFGYLTTTDAQKRCLAAVHRHLGANGLLVIEERLHTPDGLARMQARQSVPTIQMARTNPATGKYTTFHNVNTHIDTIGQAIHSTRFVEEADAEGRIRRIIPEGDGKTISHYFSIRVIHFAGLSFGT